MNLILHAEKILTYKKKHKQAAPVTNEFYVDSKDECETFYYQRSGRGRRFRGQERNKGGLRGRGRFQGQTEDKPKGKSDECWERGNTGHLAKDCPEREREQQA